MTTTIEIPMTLDIQSLYQGAGSPVLEIFIEELRSAADDIGLHVSERIKHNIHEGGKNKGLWNTGHLINSITYATEMTEQIIGVMVGTNVDYAKYKEFGTVPHFVPFHIANSLYLEAKGDWDWVEPTAKEARSLDQTRKWLKPGPKARPTWGVFVSGKAHPFIFPGWQQSIEWIEGRLLRAAQQAAARCNGGG